MNTVWNHLVYLFCSVPLHLPATIKSELLDTGAFSVSFQSCISKAQSRHSVHPWWINMNGTLAVIKWTYQTVLHVWFRQDCIDAPTGKWVGKIAILLVTILCFFVRFVSGCSLRRRVRNKACCPKATHLPTSSPAVTACWHCLALSLTPGGHILGWQRLLLKESPFHVAITLSWGPVMGSTLGGKAE